MPNRHRLGVAALVSLVGCGVTTSEYDARTAELRQATDKVKACDDNIKLEQQRTSDAQAGLEEMRALVKDLQRERRELGITGPADVQALRTASAELARQKQTAAERKSDRDRLAAGLKPELDGGVVWLDERGGQLRMVVPEEALFGAKNAQLGPPGKKLLDAIVGQVTAMPGREILVSAYLDRTDKSDGEKDMALTLDRAWHVCDYFTKHGVDKSIVAAAGFGNLEPIADNANASVRQRNRRVEIAVLPMPQPPLPQAPPPAVAAPAPAPRPAVVAPPAAPAAAPARQPAAAVAPRPAAPAPAPAPAPAAAAAGFDDPGL